MKNCIFNFNSGKESEPSVASFLDLWAPGPLATVRYIAVELISGHWLHCVTESLFVLL